MGSVRRFLLDEEGLESIELSIVVGVVVSGLVVVILAVGFWVHARYRHLQGELTDPITTPDP